ncbi:FixH family protein [Salinarimonas soli]|uniref:FixH family protein n=1 Tax=Salinarimonas soli TaxID=1638099 RepID=A0A5B2VCG1_9HYPH|nr:FixH family protein [Salinarimonas soli]KAA2236092.1 FixH family protein [Salinarimonas soli]
MTSPARLETAPAPGRPITGRMVFAAFVLFFGTIIAVNTVMLRLATSTFPGLETDSAYREGQRFNAETLAAQAQAARGWRVEASIVRDAHGRAHVAVSAAESGGAALSDLTGTLRLSHPTDRRRDRTGDLVLAGAGRYEASLDDVGTGQWTVVITFERGGERLFLSRTRAMVE